MPKDDSVRVTVRVEEEEVKIDEEAELEKKLAATIKRLMCSGGFENQVVEAVKRAMRNREFDAEVTKAIRRHVGRRW
jgi:hypothetical protein